MHDNILEVNGLTTYFFTRRGVVHAVDGVSFKIPPATTLALVGESGSGKSVTGLSIMGLVSPPGRIVSGQVWFKGRNLLELDNESVRKIRGREIAMIFQDPMTSLNPVYTVGEQIAEAVRTHEGLPRKAALAKSVEMLDRVRIPGAKQRALDYPHQLSGGMRQRVMIAIALSCNPSLLIADEPTTALDVTIQAEVLELLAKLKDEFKIALLLITHDLGVVAEVADCVEVMYAGQIVEEGTAGDIFYRAAHPYTEGLLRCVPRLDGNTGGRDRLPAIEGSVPNLIDLEPGCRFASRCSYQITECTAREIPFAVTAPGHSSRCIRSSDVGHSDNPRG
ncbi:MAG TPA: ABC transporter ATP-binding protein [Blastocatellia bacterium]